jgi:hypothetical protein
MRLRTILYYLITLLLMQTVTAGPAITSADGRDGAAAGEKLWHQEFTHAEKPRSCANCHGANPGLEGKHVRTGKRIEPMAPSITPGRLTDAKKVEKWFKRNCNWTLGRECTSDEKRHFIAYLKYWSETPKGVIQ